LLLALKIRRNLAAHELASIGCDKGPAKAL
jgi:hypothetical protein